MACLGFFYDLIWNCLSAHLRYQFRVLYPPFKPSSGVVEAVMNTENQLSPGLHQLLPTQPHHLLSDPGYRGMT